MKRPLKDAKFRITHHGQDYFKIEVDGVESEIGEFEGNIILELLHRANDEARENLKRQIINS